MDKLYNELRLRRGELFSNQKCQPKKDIKRAFSALSPSERWAYVIIAVAQAASLIR